MSPNPEVSPPHEPASTTTHGWGRSILRGLLVAVVVAAVGPLLGWIWYHVAPRLAVVRAEQGLVFAEAEPEQPVAADGWFALIGLAAGLIFAALAWLLLRRHRGIAVLAGLSLGSLVAAALALWVGYRLGQADFEQARAAAAVGTRLDGPLGLRITDLEPRYLWPPWTTGVVAVQALVAAFVYTCCAGFSPYGDLRAPNTSPDDDVYGHGQFGAGRTGSSASATGTALT